MIALRHPPPLTQGICAGRFDLPVYDPRPFIERLLANRDVVPVERVYCSPAARGRDLAHIMAARLSLPLEVDPRLQELDFGDWEGQLWNDIESNDHERFRAWANDWLRATPPNGECTFALHQRVAAFMDRIRMDPVLVVTHAGPIRAMRVLCRSNTWDEAMSEAVPYAVPIRFAMNSYSARTSAVP